MRTIEIAALDNGAHRNQTGTFSAVPDGWAEIPDGMETPNFPFGEVTVDDTQTPLLGGATKPMIWVMCIIGYIVAAFFMLQIRFQINGVQDSLGMKAGIKVMAN